MIANCVDGPEVDGNSSPQDKNMPKDRKPSESPSCSKDTRTGNPLSSLQTERQNLFQINSQEHQGPAAGLQDPNWQHRDNIANIDYSEEFRNTRPYSYRNETPGVDESLSGGIMRGGRGGTSTTSSSMEDLLYSDDMDAVEDDATSSSTSPDEDKNRRGGNQDGYFTII